MAEKVKAKPCQAWSMKSPQNWMHPFYTRKTRSDAIDSLRDNLFYRYTWRQLKRQGWSCVRVEIREVKKKGRR